MGLTFSPLWHLLGAQPLNDRTESSPPPRNRNWDRNYTRCEFLRTVRMESFCAPQWMGSWGRPVAWQRLQECMALPRSLVGKAALRWARQPTRLRRRARRWPLGGPGVDEGVHAVLGVQQEGGVPPGQQPGQQAEPGAAGGGEERMRGTPKFKWGDL